MKDGTFMNTIKRRVLQIITLGEIGGAQTHLLDIIKKRMYFGKYLIVIG
jgi:hypothetical protein